MKHETKFFGVKKPAAVHLSLFFLLHPMCYTFDPHTNKFSFTTSRGRRSIPRRKKAVEKEARMHKFYCPASNNQHHSTARRRSFAKNTRKY